MTPAESRNIITSRYLNEFDGQFPIATDNIKFTKPIIPQKWARVRVNFVDGEQNTLGKVGNRKFLKLGNVVVEIYTPSNHGTNENDTLSQSSLALLDGYNITGLWLYNGKIVTIGNQGPYYQQNVIIEFTFEDIR